MAAYRMTPARKAALRKAQLASARKRKGRGKKKTTSNRRRNIRRGVVVAAGVSAVVGAGYTYKNRERLIVQPMAQRKFVKIAEVQKGRKLTKAERKAVMLKEKRDHASRSTGVARIYLEARGYARSKQARGKSLNPKSKNYFMGKVPTDTFIDKNGKKKSVAKYLHEMYRKDVNARARHRLNKMKGRKTVGFSYKSGKQVRVGSNGRVKRLWW